MESQLNNRNKNKQKRKNPKNNFDKFVFIDHVLSSVFQQ